jgi:hypothetical protein
MGEGKMLDIKDFILSSGKIDWNKFADTIRPNGKINHVDVNLTDYYCHKEIDTEQLRKKLEKAVCG